MSAQDNMKFARSVYELFDQHQLAKADAYAAADAVITLVPTGQVFKGREGFMQFMTGFERAFPDLNITVVNQVATDDMVVSECTWTGTHTGPLATPAGDIPPTGKQVSGARFCEVWRIKDGKLTSLTNYQDMASWLRQLGLVP